jgi:hypothetical protein
MNRVKADRGVSDGIASCPIRRYPIAISDGHAGTVMAKTSMSQNRAHSAKRLEHRSL